MSRKKRARTQSVGVYDYAYAVGRVRALEKKMVSKAVFHEAALEKNFADAVNVVGEVGALAVDMSTAANAAELDGLLVQEWENFLLSEEDIFLEKEILVIVSSERNPEKALAAAITLGYGFISDFFRYKLDLGNLKVLARAKYLELPPPDYEKHLLSGGFLVLARLHKLYDLGWDEIKEDLKATAYSRLWEKGLDSLREQESFVRLERGIEDFLMLYLRQAKYIVFGPEPLFAYAMAKKKELDLLRLLGMGKLLQVPAAVIQNRMSETYV